jgi:hypothetical protein
MHDVELFSRALGLDEPWEVVGVQFDGDQRRLDLRVDFPKGSRFACPQCAAAGCKVHDSEQKTAGDEQWVRRDKPAWRRR